MNTKVIIIQTIDYFVHIHFSITGWLVLKKPKIYKYILHFSNKDIYDFYNNPSSYVSTMKKYLSCVDILITGHYHSELSPPMAPESAAEILYSSPILSRTFL